MRFFCALFLFCIISTVSGVGTAQTAALPAPSQPVAATPAPSSLPAATTQGASGELHILFTSDIYGRFAWPGCGTRPKNRADLSHLAAAVRQRRRALQQSGKGEPLLLSGGSMIRPDVLGNHVFGPGRVVAPAAIKLIRDVGFNAVSVGAYDFGTNPESLEHYMKLMHQAQIPLLAANVSCDKKDDFRCRFLGRQGTRYLLQEQDGLRVALFSVVREDMTKTIRSKSVGSMTVEDPVETAKTMIRSLRSKERADVVILLANVNDEGNTPQAAIDFVRALGKDAPDLVVTDAMYSRDTGDFIDHVRTRGGPPIVGTDRFGQHLGEAVFRWRRAGDAVSIDGVDILTHHVAQHPPDPQAAPLVQQMMDELCRSISGQLGQSAVKTSLSLAAFKTYLMEIMRNRLNAEIAIINNSAIADTSFPMEGKISNEKVLRAVRTETQLGYFRMTGATLVKKLGLPYVVGKKPGLNLLGLTKKGKKYYVNNRLINDDQHYKVACTGFVAGGGDGLISLYTEKFASAETTLRQAVIDFFKDGGPARVDGDPTVDLATDFPDPWEKWLLYTGLDFGVFFSNVVLDNGASGSRYNKPMLTRDNLTSLKFDVGLDLGASNRDHAVEGDIILQYGQTWTNKPGTDEITPAESLDRIRADFLYRLTLWRNKEVPSLWYMPVPYVEVSLVSEFTSSGCSPYGDTVVCDEDDANYNDPTYIKGETYHYLDLGGTVGLGMLPHPNLFFKVGFAVNGELLTPAAALAPGDDQEARTGIYLGYKLRRLKLNKSVHYPIQLESRLDFYLTDFSNTLRRELTWETKLLFNILPMIYITAAHRLYVFDARMSNLTDGDGASVANDISIGLEFLTDYRYQTH